MLQYSSHIDNRLTCQTNQNINQHKRNRKTILESHAFY